MKEKYSSALQQAGRVGISAALAISLNSSARAQGPEDGPYVVIAAGATSRVIDGQTTNIKFKVFTLMSASDGIDVLGQSIPSEKSAPIPEPVELVPGCPAIISEALGSAGCAVSFCESKWNPNATGSIGEKGYFQINPWVHPDATYDPAGNIAAAVRISNDGNDWDAWSVRSVLTNGGLCPDGTYVPGSEPHS